MAAPGTVASPRILVVEDEEHLADGIRFNLEAEGYEVDVVGDGTAALQQITAGAERYDLVILDLMLPGLDGFEVTTRARQQGDLTPILMLTARSLTEDVVHGLTVGADDYLSKPFDLGVLLARVRSLLRRRDWTRAAGDTGPAKVQIGIATVDFLSFEITTRGQTEGLTLLEAAFLRLLHQNAGRVVSRGEILEKVWNLAADTETRAVDNFVVRLRRFIEENPAEPTHLVTVRGAGWKLSLPAPERSDPPERSEGTRGRS